MITLYQFEISPYCDKIRRILQYKGVPYETEDVSVQDTLQGKIRKKNRAGKLPFIEDGNRVVADSTDIAWYLEAKYPDKPLLPEDPKDRALVHFLEDWADESLYFFEVYLRLALAHNARKWIPQAAREDNFLVKKLMTIVGPAQFKQQTKAQGLGRKGLGKILEDLGRHVQQLEHWLGDAEWLVGDSISLADIAVYVQLNCVAGTPEGTDILSRHTVVTEWMQRVRQATDGAV